MKTSKILFVFSLILILAVSCSFLDNDDDSDSVEYQLTVADDGNGTTTPSGTVTVNKDETTSISATPDTGYSFENWEVTTGTATIADSDSAITTVTLSGGNATVTAAFIMAADGTITVQLTGASAFEGDQVFTGAFTEGGPYEPANVVASASGVISGGGYSGVLNDGTNPVAFTGGIIYELYLMIDADNSDTLTSGDYIQNEMKAVTVDGNETVSFVYPTDFMLNP